MLAVVIDTNVLISAALTGKGHTFQIIELLSSGALQLYYSPEILAEYKDVLSRPKFNFSTEKQRTLIDKIEEAGVKIDALRSNTPHFTDESDRIFYDVSKSGKAILITGNKRHYPDEPFIVTPTEFLTLFKRSIMPDMSN